jgi:amidophosphoribosyltransferase
MAVSDGRTLTVVKDMGLVTNVFDERTLRALSGSLAIGHTRYSTTGASCWENAQPVYRAAGPVGFAVAHNGNLTNTGALAGLAGTSGVPAGSDSDLVAELLAEELSRNPSGGLVGALRTVLPWLEGAFSLVLLDEHCLVGVRDPHGFRPLCLGRLGEDGWVLASETPALDIVGARFVRELEPGEMVVVDEDGPRSHRPFGSQHCASHLCVFELVYFARPDALLLGREVHGARRRMGELLAQEAPVEADLVMGVPDSGLPAAEGYALASGIPFGQGLVKNRYIGRTFIAPTPEARSLGVRRKLNPLRENVAGRRLIVVDDSVVRGTTQRALTRMLREAGAREVHLRISSPPYRWPCYFGIDTGRPEELLARRMPVEAMAAELGADSLAFLSLEHLREAVGVPGADLCEGCLTGSYPAPIPPEGSGLDERCPLPLVGSRGNG